MTIASDLPIEDVLPEILAALEAGPRLVITAPPGAGKTTRVPLALLDQSWRGDNKVIVVEPRRIAARAAAERMAAMLGERVSATVGLRSRLDVRTSAASRIEVVTEGVFTRMILSDPALDGVAAVIFDEFHERSLDADEGLAFALDAQAVLREDLRIVLMSATLPPNLTQAFFAGPVAASDGRAHAVTTQYLGFDARRRVEDQAVSAIRRALAEETGSLLVFLPGAAEIQRTAERLDGLPADIQIAPLYGALTPAEQNAAIAPAPAGVRKIVLATDIAESAITIEGVRVVIDCGLARVPRFDPSASATRLETVRISVASADQRRGRAGRTQPGVCYRLWREAEMGGFAAAPSPEIENADLTGLVLDLARWGARAPEQLRWLNPPRDTPWRRAREGLIETGALTAEGELTATGRRIGEIALPPRLALMVLNAARTGDALLAAEIAALLSERELGGRSTDLGERLTRFRSDKGHRARAMRDLATRWAREAGGGKERTGASAGEILAGAFPERIARARGGAPGRFVMAGGRGAMLSDTDPMSREQWVVAADVTGAGPDLRITLAARISERDIVALGAIKTDEEAKYYKETGAVRARRVRRLGAIVLEETPLPSPPAVLVREALLDVVREDGFDVIPNAAPLLQLIARVQFLAKACGGDWPETFETTLTARLDDWLSPLLESMRSLNALNGGGLADAAKAVLDWPLPREVDRLAPARWTTPAGPSVEINYLSDGGPVAECRVQEVYGLGVHPMLADGRAPLILSLLSPARRPVAITRDLPGFWRGGYSDMRKDMKGRYPKHDWPEDPASAQPVTRPPPRAR